MEGQCVLLKKILRIKKKIYFIFLNSQHYSMNHILPVIFLKPLEKIGKILETRPQSSKNAHKWIKIRKIHDVDKHWFLVFNSFFVFNPGS